MVNEPILGYLHGSKERTALESALSKWVGLVFKESLWKCYSSTSSRHATQCEDIPIVIGGKEYRTDNVQYQVIVLEKKS